MPELVLPEPECRPEDGAWALNAGVAARWVMGRLGTAKPRMEAFFTRVLTHRCMAHPSQGLGAAARLAVESRRQYEADWGAGKLRWGPWGIANFFGEGHWQNRALWPYKPEVRAAEAGARRTAEEAAACGLERFGKQRIAAFLLENAAALEAAACGLEGIAAQVRELGGSELPLEALDLKITALEDAMTRAVLEGAAEEDRAEWRQMAEEVLRRVGSRMGAAAAETLRWQMVQKFALEARGLPRLSIFYMPNAQEAESLSG
jgi:hypothetical protein